MTKNLIFFQEISKLQSPSADPSQLWLRKMVTLFTRLDRDRDGYLTYNDIVIIGDTFSKFGILTEKQEKFKCRNLISFWKTMLKGQQRVDVEEFVTSRIPLIRPLGKANKVLAKLDPQSNPQSKLIQDSEVIFDVIDTDGNGVISEKEFIMFFKCLYIHDADFAINTFSKIDLNKDQMLSRNEFTVAFEDFMLNENESRYKELFGPLLH